MPYTEHPDHSSAVAYDLWCLFTQIMLPFDELSFTFKL